MFYVRNCTSEGMRRQKNPSVPLYAMVMASLRGLGFRQSPKWGNSPFPQGLGSLRTLLSHGRGDPWERGVVLRAVGCWGRRNPPGTVPREAVTEGCDGCWGTWGADLSLSDQVSLLSSFSLTAAAQPGKHPCLLLLPLPLWEWGYWGGGGLGEGGAGCRCL